MNPDPQTVSPGPQMVDPAPQPADAEPPAIDPGLAAATLAVFAHRHEVVHLLYAATDEPDALTRIADLLHVDEATIARVLDQPLRWILPQFRAELESIAATSPQPQLR